MSSSCPLPLIILLILNVSAISLPLLQSVNKPQILPNDLNLTSLGLSPNSTKSLNYTSDPTIRCSGRIFGFEINLISCRQLIDDMEEGEIEGTWENRVPHVRDGLPFRLLSSEQTLVSVFFLGLNTCATADGKCSVEFYLFAPFLET